MSDPSSTPKAPQSVLRYPATVDLSHRQEILSPEFERFLCEHRTEAGDILLDLKPGPWTEPEMRALERTIKAHAPDDRVAIDFFRLLTRFAECWIMRRKAEATMPKMALHLPDAQNPFKMDLAKAFRNHRSWGSWLRTTLQSAIPRRNGAKLPPFVSAVPLLASSILYGGLWNEDALVALVKAVPKLLSCTMATKDAMYVGLALRWGDLPLGEFRCWQPWLLIEPTFAPGSCSDTNSGLFGFRCLMVISYIYFSEQQWIAKGTGNPR